MVQECTVLSLTSVAWTQSQLANQLRADNGKHHAYLNLFHLLFDAVHDLNLWFRLPHNRVRTLVATLASRSVQNQADGRRPGRDTATLRELSWIPKSHSALCRDLVDEVVRETTNSGVVRRVHRWLEKRNYHERAYIIVRLRSLQTKRRV